MSAASLLPWVIHEALEYVVGLFLILAPFIFDLREGIAFPMFVATGVVFIVLALLTPGKATVASALPVRAHATLDYLLGLFLVLAPFLFRFSDVETALYVSMFVGVAHLVVTLVTKFPVGEATPQER